MALRLTGSSAVSQPAFSPTEIANHANVLLAAGDVTRYAELFERAGGHPDPSERHHARLRLVESALRAAATSTPALATRVYLAAAQALVEILAEAPCEPLLLNYAGVAFYELWSLRRRPGDVQGRARASTPSSPICAATSASRVRRRSRAAPGAPPSARCTANCRPWPAAPSDWPRAPNRPPA